MPRPGCTLTIALASFLLTSVYHYGTDTASRWRSLPSFVAPSLFEDRVSDLFVPYVAAMSSALPQHRAPSLPPRRSRLDLIIYSSGFWDLAAWARDDIRAGSSATTDLSESRLLEWRARSVDMVVALSKAWPKTSLAWRSSQIPHSTETATVEWWTGELGEGEQVSPSLTRAERKPPWLIFLDPAEEPPSLLAQPPERPHQRAPLRADAARRRRGQGAARPRCALPAARARHAVGRGEAAW